MNDSPDTPKSEGPRQVFPLIVGEVLWDCFENRRVLGGAPLNVAWNLAGFGLDPLFVSAVGDDALGFEIIRKMQDFGMSTDGIAVLPDVQTGTVQVTMHDGEPHYEIVSGVAWDAIPTPAHTVVRGKPLQAIIDERAQAADSVLMYHGSLACRDPRSRATIETIRDSIQGDVFFDVNLRAPHFETSMLEELRRHASFIKLNFDELGELSRDLQMDGATTPEQRTSTAGVALDQTAATPLKTLLVTLGAEGALAYRPETDSLDRIQSPKPEKMIDPVGAGDAFAAVVIHGILMRRHLSDVLPDAVAFASRVCGLAGATCSDRDFYALNHFLPQKSS
ncbi:PfkB family carbohydrate kinase [Neorhodopirellula pilleata]|uniref:Aminoimidazole riboside kinase n=1 Tax=Neorhodopirellula pilleata TaxID=2714738 RepID=A0A5C6AQS0_9BACT|nr:PfkB family carbohydrate kinase [Neorhodopirellula pilleata]TWU02070.1 aminoimidazole riboside kinase [Neorhodopirellula pilleata]